MHQTNLLLGFWKKRISEYIQSQTDHKVERGGLSALVFLRTFWWQQLSPLAEKTIRTYLEIQLATGIVRSKRYAQNRTLKETWSYERHQKRKDGGQTTETHGSHLRKRYESEFHHGVVHKAIAMQSAMIIADAKAAADRKWDKFEKSTVLGLQENQTQVRVELERLF